MVVEWDWGVRVHVNPRGEWTLHPWKEVHFTNEETGSKRHAKPTACCVLLEDHESKHLLPDTVTGSGNEHLYCAWTSRIWTVGSQ